MKIRQFFSVPRNLAALVLCIACLIVNIAGILYGYARFTAGVSDQARLNYVVQQGVLGCFTIFAVYAAEWLFRFRLPLPAELSVTLLAFMGNTMAGVYGMYSVHGWDKFLHTFSGVLFAAIGLSVALAFLNKRADGTKKILAAAVFAVFFALAEGYLWEIYEFTVDSLLGSNAQGWQGSLLESYPDGTFLVSDKRGAALIDTMFDMIVNFAGALLFTIPAAVVCLKKPRAADILAVHALPPFRRRNGRRIPASDRSPEHEKTPHGDNREPNIPHTALPPQSPPEDTPSAACPSDPETDMPAQSSTQPPCPSQKKR